MCIRDRLKGDEFVTTEERLVEQKIKILLDLNVSEKRCVLGHLL